MRFRSLVVFGALLVGCTSASDETATAGSNLDESALTGLPLPAMWPNRGSAGCQVHAGAVPASFDAIYKYKYDENTYILRENKCLNYEANFIYLLFGHDKVLMQDTGSIPRGFDQAQFKAAFPIRDFVE